MKMHSRAFASFTGRLYVVFTKTKERGRTRRRRRKHTSHCYDGQHPIAVSISSRTTFKNLRILARLAKRRHSLTWIYIYIYIYAIQVFISHKESNDTMPAMLRAATQKRGDSPDSLPPIWPYIAHRTRRRPAYLTSSSSDATTLPSITHWSTVVGCKCSLARHVAAACSATAAAAAAVAVKLPVIYWRRAREWSRSSSALHTPNTELSAETATSVGAKRRIDHTHDEIIDAVSRWRSTGGTFWSASRVF